MLYNTLLITQTKYIRDLLQKTNMSEASPNHTLMESTCNLTKTSFIAFSNPYMYRSLVGALQYATITRSDIEFYMNKVSQFMAHPLESH